MTAFPLPASPAPLSVCIVTHEFFGIPGSGGIGTAFTGLAESLAAGGHAVTVLCSGLLPLPPGFADESGDAAPYGAVTRVRLPAAPTPVDADPFLRLSYEAFLWLAERRFDVIHFADWTGLGFCATSAKRLGAAFPDTCLTVGLHGPTRWVRSVGGGAFEGPEDLAIDFLERRSAEQADRVVSPSRYLLDWLRESGWALPERAEVRQNILPAPSNPQRTAPATAQTVRELIFFGRLEERKGVVLFCDALDRLAADPQSGSTADLRVAFLGGSAPVGGEDGAAYVRRRATRWPWPVEARHGLSSREALDHLAVAGRLAVIPSLIENSPCTVAECLIRGLPVLASRVGGTAELVAEADAERVLFEPNADALAARLTQALRDGTPSARLRVPQDQVADEWLAWHAALRESAPKRSAEAAAAPSANTHALLAEPGLRLTVDGMERLTAAAAHSGAAAVGCAVIDEQSGAHRLRAGGPAGLALFRDVHGPGPFLVRQDALNGASLPEDAVGRRALLVRLALDGHAIAMLPLPLATLTGGGSAQTDDANRLAPFLTPDLPTPLSELARVALGLDRRINRLSEERKRAEDAANRLAKERRVLSEERNQLAAAMEAASAQGEEERILWRARLAERLDSRSWRFTAPLRRRFKGIGESGLAALPPDRAADLVTSSVWWDLGAVWRLAARMARRVIRR